MHVLDSSFIMPSRVCTYDYNRDEGDLRSWLRRSAKNGGYDRRSPVILASCPEYCGPGFHMDMVKVLLWERCSQVFLAAMGLTDDDEAPTTFESLEKWVGPEWDAYREKVEVQQGTTLDPSLEIFLKLLPELFELCPDAFNSELMCVKRVIPELVIDTRYPPIKVEFVKLLWGHVKPPRCATQEWPPLKEPPWEKKTLRYLKTEASQWRLNIGHETLMRQVQSLGNAFRHKTSTASTVDQSMSSGAMKGVVRNRVVPVGRK